VGGSQLIAAHLDAVRRPPRVRRIDAEHDRATDDLVCELTDVPLQVFFQENGIASPKTVARVFPSLMSTG
jgi:hypothetical protein